MPCNNLISDNNIQYIYNDNKYIINNSITSECLDNNTKSASIDIFDKHSRSMLEQRIERTYYRDKELLSSESNGKVVKHELFKLNDNYRNKRIAIKLHEKELEIYKNNDFKEIQLDAAWDGLIVWKKLFFKYASPKDESLVKIAIQKYLKDVKGLSREEIMKEIKNNPFSVKVSLLSDNSNPNNNFIRWVYTNFGLMTLPKMYKEIR